MKCPACENDVPSGRSACPRCGAPLPLAGERPGPEPHLASGSPTAGPSNPKTEPLPIPVWDDERPADEGEERPWNVPPERFAGTDATGPGSAPQNFGAPAAHPRPLEHDPAASGPNTPPPSPTPLDDHRTRWNLDASEADPVPPGQEPAGRPVPGTDSSPAGQDSAARRYGSPWGGPGAEHTPSAWNQPAPGADPAPPAQDPATQRFDAPWPEPGAPSEHTPAAWNQPAPGMDPAPPAQDPATQRYGAPWPDLGPAPESGPGAWGQSDTSPAGQGPAPQNLGSPWPDPPPPPGFDPAGWNQGGPPAPGQTAGGRTGKNRKMLLLAGGIAVVVLLGGGLTYALTRGGSGTATPTPTAKRGAGSSAQQAAAVNQVLKSGKTARGHLPTRLRTCDDVSAGVPGFQQVVRDRQQELSQSRELKVDQLQDGPRLRRSMILAYQSSLQADQAYLAWAQEVQARGCGDRIAPLTAHYRAAISANDKAGPAKRQVAGLWRPIASSHGLPTYAWNRL